MDFIEEIIKENIFLKDYIYKKYSKSFYGHLKSSNALFYINNKEVSINTHLKENDIFKIEYINKVKETKSIDKEVNVIYEDEYILILDKGSNLLTIPSIKEEDSLYSRLINKYKNDSINIITRLDKLTSGLVLVSKKSYLVDTISKNILLKEYIAKTNNYLPNEEGIINLPIKKSDTIKRIVDKEGKESITKYKLINKDKYIYKLELVTGRTHQIRVHLSYNNCPIVGDDLYGGIHSDKLHLIAYKLKLIHPITNEEISVESKYRLE